MSIRIRSVLFFSAIALAGCGSLTPPKYENGDYVPPPADNPLEISLEDNVCGSSGKNKAFGAVVAGVLAPALVNQAYDRFINWLDSKQANLSASSSGISTTTFFTDNDSNLVKGCVILKRGDSLEARFSINSIGDTPYWVMKPYSLAFKRSEAKEGQKDSKSLVAEIAFSTPGADGKLVTFFQGTFDLGKRIPGGSWTATGGTTPFVGQDSGPIPFPKSPEDKTGKKVNEYLVMKVTASVIEHGEGRDWIRGVTDSLREKENRQKILQPVIDALSGGQKK